MIVAKKTCAHCGNKYKRHRSFGREQWAVSKFCSRSCAAAVIRGIKTGPKPEQRIGSMKSCIECGAAFYVEPNRAVAGRGKFCSKACCYAGRELKGTFQVGHADLVPADKRGHSEETKRKISEAQRIKNIRGAAHHNYKNGSRTLRQKEMGRWEYKEWRSAVFHRDNFTCQECGKHGGYLQADHIKPWVSHPDLRFAVGNGRTLCTPCHRKTPTWGRKAMVA